MLRSGLVERPHLGRLAKLLSIPLSPVLQTEKLTREQRSRVDEGVPAVFVQRQDDQVARIAVLAGFAMHGLQSDFLVGDDVRRDPLPVRHAIDEHRADAAF